MGGYASEEPPEGFCSSGAFTRVGRVTSAAFGHTLGRSVGLGYVACPGGVMAEWLAAGRFAVEIARSRHAARASLTPFYDPANARVRC